MQYQGIYVNIMSMYIFSKIFNNLGINNNINKKTKALPVKQEDLISTLSRATNISDLNLYYINKSGINGLNTKELNRCVLEEILSNDNDIEDAIKIKEITNILHKKRVELSKSNKISFNKNKKIWYPIKTRRLTDKEKRFFKAKNIDPFGWKNIPNRMYLIKFIYQFTDDEFEQFCCAFLEHIELTNIKVTKKRNSGAGGGIDGLGEYHAGQETVPIVFEAKRHNPIKAQIGTDICQKLCGAMVENNVKHGFIITTAKFSDRSLNSVRKIEENNGYKIMLIDQNTMIEFMAYPYNAPHGLGVYETEKGFIYMNKRILKQATKNS